MEHFVVLLLGFSVLSSSFHVQRSLTCYSCEERTSNADCNRAAIDRPCPSDRDLCFSKHTMGSNGETINLIKGCVSRAVCDVTWVGCRRPGRKGYWDAPKRPSTVCVSCCDQGLCNRTPPTNDSDARLGVRDYESSGVGKDSAKWSCRTLIVALALPIWTLRIPR